MKYEHWRGRDSDTLLEAGRPDKAALIAGETLCCTIEADSWEEANRLYHEHQGWEPYRPWPRA